MLHARRAALHSESVLRTPFPRTDSVADDGDGSGFHGDECRRQRDPGFADIAEKNQPALIGLPTRGCRKPRARTFTAWCASSDLSIRVRRHTGGGGEYPGFHRCWNPAMRCGEGDDRRAGAESAASANAGSSQRAAGSLLTRAIWSTSGTHRDVRSAPGAVPDLSDSLDGHLTNQESSPLTVGGTPVAAIAPG